MFFNPYAIPPLVVSIAFLFMGFFILIKNKKSIINKLFAFVYFSTFVWQFGYFLAYSTKDPAMALLYIKFLYVGVTFIPLFFYHFNVAFLDLKNEGRILRISYALCSIFAILGVTTPFLIKGVYKAYWGHMTLVGFMHNLYLIVFFFLYFRSIYKLYTRYKAKEKMSPIEHTRIKYVFVAFLIATFGALDFIPKYGVIRFYPIGFIPIAITLMIINYAILRHRLMEIELIIKKTVIFAGLFAFVSMSFVGATFLVQEFLADILGGNTRTVILLFSITVITLGMRPLENALVRLTDKVLFQKKYDYQETLKEASDGMTLVTDMRKLLNFIARVVSKNIRVKNAAIFQLDEEEDRYILRIRRGTSRKHIGYSLGKNNALVSWIREHKETLLYDEIEDWLKSERFLRKERNLKEKLIGIKEEFLGLDGAICIPSSSKGKLIGFLILGEKLSGDIYTQEDVRLLSTLASEAAIAIENAKNFMELEKLREKERESYVQTVLALAQTVDEKDSYTHGHLEDVCHYGLQVAEELESSAEFKASIDKESLKTALRLHDIGKIGVPDAILHKSGKLTAQEWNIMKQHCVIGARIVEPLEKLKNVGKIIKHHQEKYDGTGYPDGLKGENIPLESRIVSVVDAYHAMVSDRPYRKALSEEDALKELKNNIGTQFDPVVVGAFVAAWEKGKIKKI